MSSEEQQGFLGFPSFKEWQDDNIGLLEAYGLTSVPDGGTDSLDLDTSLSPEMSLPLRRIPGTESVTQGASSRWQNQNVSAQQRSVPNHHSAGHTQMQSNVSAAPGGYQNINLGFQLANPTSGYDNTGPSYLPWSNPVSVTSPAMFDRISLPTSQGQTAASEPLESTLIIKPVFHIPKVSNTRYSDLSLIALNVSLVQTDEPDSTKQDGPVPTVLFRMKHCFFQDPEKDETAGPPLFWGSRPVGSSLRDIEAEEPAAVIEWAGSEAYDHPLSIRGRFSQVTFSTTHSMPWSTISINPASRRFLDVVGSFVGTKLDLPCKAVTTKQFEELDHQSIRFDPLKQSAAESTAHQNVEHARKLMRQAGLVASKPVSVKLVSMNEDGNMVEISTENSPGTPQTTPRGAAYKGYRPIAPRSHSSLGKRTCETDEQQPLRARSSSPFTQGPNTPRGSRYHTDMTQFHVPLFHPDTNFLTVPGQSLPTQTYQDPPGSTPPFTGQYATGHVELLPNIPITDKKQPLPG